MIRILWVRWWDSLPGRYLLNVLLGLDQLGNTLIGGHHDETISSRLGRRKVEAYLAGERLPLGWHLLDQLLEFLDPGHAIDAIEWDEVQEWVAEFPEARLQFNKTGRVVGLRTA